MGDKAETEDQSEELVGTVYDLIKDIQDPEKPETLEELEVVYEEGVEVSKIRDTDAYYIKIEFTPTVPHCSLATLIGLCLRVKLERDLPQRHKLDILIKEGSHTTGPEIVKQINDKERVAAALENPNLNELVYSCINNTPV